MVHAIVYANRKGYNFFESTPEFPQSYQQQIYNICSRLTAGSVQSAPALRYMPLNSRGLLTVIFRMIQGNSDEIRAHAIAVNFLMDAEDTRRFFDCPFRDAAAKAIATAEEILNIRNRPLPTDLLQDLPQNGSAMMYEPSTDLLSAAIYAMDYPISRQMFIQNRLSDPIDMLQELLDFLPPRLRPTVSFHTNCINAAESDGLVVCFTNCLSDMISQDFSGGPITQKYWRFCAECNAVSNPDQTQVQMVYRMLQMPQRIPHYHFLKPCINSWECLLRLNALLKASTVPKLESVLELIPSELVYEALRTASLDADDRNKIQRAMPKQSPVHGLRKIFIRLLSLLRRSS